MLILYSVIHSHSFGGGTEWKVATAVWQIWLLLSSKFLAHLYLMQLKLILLATLKLLALLQVIYEASKLLKNIYYFNIHKDK